MVHHDRVIASITIASRTLDDVPAASRTILEAIATTVGSALARVRAEQESRRRQADYEALCDTSPDLLFVVDRDELILYANGTAIESLGYAGDVLQRMRITDLREETPDPSPSHAATLAGASSTAAHTVALLTAQGQLLPVDIRVAAGTWFGKPVAIHVARDTRERQRHERLLSTERDLAVAVAAAQSTDEVMNLCLDAALHVTGLESAGIWLAESPASARLAAERGNVLGYACAATNIAADGVCGTLLRTAGPSCRDVHGSAWAWNSAWGPDIQCVTTYPVELEGTWLATLAVGTTTREPLPDWMCRALEAIAVHLRQALFRRQTTALLRKLNRAIEQSSSTVVITDPQGVIEYANPRFEETTGYAVSEALGKTPSLLCSGEQPPEFYKELWATITSHGDWRGEFHNRRKDGSLYWEAATISPICDERGRITHFVAVKDDVTERKRAEDELRRSSESLARHVQALEAANTSLQHANHLAESSTRAKSEFLANMSHEIRTPMTAILGFTEVLAASVNNTEQADAIRIIRRNGEHLLTLINDILDLSRIEAGKLAIERIPTDPAVLLEEVAASMRIRAETKHLALTVEYVGPIPDTVSTDPTRLRQILVNLVGNAIKFTDTGRVRIVAQTHGLDTPSPTLEFQVSDTGVGMTAEQLTHLFRPFQQADASTTRQFGGTGLGLAISKRLIEMLGGTIAVKSEAGRGSTFAFTVAAGSLATTALHSPISERIAENVSRQPASSGTGRPCVPGPVGRGWAGQSTTDQFPAA